MIYKFDFIAKNGIKDFEYFNTKKEGAKFCKECERTVTSIEKTSKKEIFKKQYSLKF